MGLISAWIISCLSPGNSEGVHADFVGFERRVRTSDCFSNRPRLNARLHCFNASLVFTKSPDLRCLYCLCMLQAHNVLKMQFCLFLAKTLQKS